MIRALYVDDDAYALELAREFLEDPCTLQLDTVSSGTMALREMAARRYDVIISDYCMPSMNGLELLKGVRHRSADVPFILFTGRGREDVVIDALNAGTTFYVRKGADIKAQFFELDHKIRQAVARWRAEDRLRTSKCQDRMIMDLAHIARWEYDLSQDALRFDDVSYDLYGTNSEQEGGYVWKGKDYLDEFVHPDDRDKVSRFVSLDIDTIPEGGYLQITHRIIRRDGQVRCILVRVGKMVDEEGHAIRLMGICMDIT